MQFIYEMLNPTEQELSCPSCYLSSYHPLHHQRAPRQLVCSVRYPIGSLSHGFRSHVVQRGRYRNRKLWL
jgi:hypothetical protein